MFDALNIYDDCGHFFLMAGGELTKNCNAPRDKAGVYILNALARGRIEIVYIGSSGKVISDGRIKLRQGGLYDRIVNGKQFDGPRRVSWIERMQKEDIEGLDVYWYVTFNKEIKDIPGYVEGLIMQHFFALYGRLPRWNVEY